MAVGKVGHQKWPHQIHVYPHVAGKYKYLPPSKLTSVSTQCV